MNIIRTEFFHIQDYQFKILSKRNINKDCLEISVEDESDSMKNLSHIKSYVAMKGEFELKAEDYTGYKEAVDAVKELLNMEVKKAVDYKK